MNALLAYLLTVCCGPVGLVYGATGDIYRAAYMAVVCGLVVAIAYRKETSHDQ